MFFPDATFFERWFLWMQGPQCPSAGTVLNKRIVGPGLILEFFVRSQRKLNFSAASR